MKARKILSIKVMSILFFVVVVLGAFSMFVYKVEAATTTITLETDKSQINNGDEITVSIYLNSDTNIGAYHVEVAFDSYRLQYVSGADTTNGDKVILEGTGYGKDIVYKVAFKTISGGKAEISCSSAQVGVQGLDTGNKQNVSYAGSARLTIDGEDTATKQQNLDRYGIDSEVPLCGVVDTSAGKRYYIVDHFRYVPEDAKWKYYLIKDTYDKTTYTFLTNSDNNVRILYLMDKEGSFVMYAYSKAKKALYPCQLVESEGTAYYVMSPNACDQWAEELTLDYVKKENICYAIRSDGVCGFYKYDDGVLTLWTEDEGQKFLENQMDLFYNILLIAIGIVTVVIIAILVSNHIKEKKQEKEKAKHPEYNEEQPVSDSNIEFINVDDNDKSKKKDDRDKYKEKPVIAIKDVTMKFRISTSSASGLKELLIQKIKRQVVTKEFTALNHVSMNIYKGEIVGIIGTNGSGKSTLLKIVSGALVPSSGKVNVDRNKVQLLSLGTGFDKELTARENIYLSGAIIGYSKEFIDENFDNIIKFAELQDFVDERVKNFSSGMVSRLGFAIATVGNAAEILILDEILSVGDEFFKKKSLKRVHEIIHSGATVVMVSHGMSTIMDNCTKVIWLEKGKVKMIGDPKIVCKTYRKFSR